VIKLKEKVIIGSRQRELRTQILKGEF